MIIEFIKPYDGQQTIGKVKVLLDVVSLHKN